MGFNVEEYKKQVFVNRFRNVESLTVKGLFFKIKKLNQKERLILTKTLGVFNEAQIKNPDVDFEKKIKDTDLEKQFEMMEAIIIASVVEPKITKQQEDGALCIDDISQEDYDNLCMEVSGTKKSVEEKKDELLPSPKKCKSPRRNGEKV